MRGLTRIPMNGSVESFNVPVSPGICLFEARRQRGGRVFCGAIKVGASGTAIKGFRSSVYWSA
jgi:hypothetical protein